MIGLEEVQDGVWSVICYETLHGRFVERTRTITGAPSLKKDCQRCPQTKCHLSSQLFMHWTKSFAVPRRCANLR